MKQLKAVKKSKKENTTNSNYTKIAQVGSYTIAQNQSGVNRPCTFSQ